MVIGYEDFHKLGNKVSAKKGTFFSRELLKEHARESVFGTALITFCIPYLWKHPYVDNNISMFGTNLTVSCIPSKELDEARHKHYQIWIAQFVV